MELEKKLSTVEVGTLAPQEYVQLSKDAAQYSQLAEVYNERAELLKVCRLIVAGHGVSPVARKL